MSAAGSVAGVPGTYTEVEIGELQLWAGNVREAEDVTSLDELIQSIREQGLLQPPVARRTGGKLEVIAGQRRTLALRALKEEGVLNRVLVLDIGEIEDSRATVISLVENIQREDIRPSQEARTISRLFSTPGTTLRQIAADIGRSESTVRRMARVGELDESNLKLLDQGELTLGQAELLAEATPGMRRTVLKWLREGTDLDQARTMLSNRSGRFSLESALFTREEYEQLSPGKLETDLFGTTHLHDRAAFIELQQKALTAQIQQGQHGAFDDHSVHVSAGLPAELGLQEDDAGTILVGVISPTTGTTRVIRASRAERQEVDHSVSETLREQAMNKLRGVIARQALERDPALAERVLGALMLNQLEGGARCFVISRQSSQTGRDQLGSAHPSRGMTGDLAEALAGGAHYPLGTRLRELYEGTPETDAIILGAFSIRRVTLGAERLRGMNTEEISSLVPGVVRAGLEETLRQVEGVPIELERQPLPTSQEWARQTAERIKASGLESQAPYSEVLSHIAADEYVSAIDLMTPEAQDQLQRQEVKQRASATFSEDELLSAYDSLEGDDNAREFREAIDNGDMARANSLLGQLRSVSA